MNRVVDLPSGAKLEIQVAPFADSKALYVAVLEEGKTLKLDPQAEIDVNFFKDVFCSGFSSQKIDRALDQCMKRCLYNGLKIDGETFEPVEARQDYLIARFEVARENVVPFTKGLSAKYEAVLAKVTGLLMSSTETKKT